jgi:3,4-dihydroxy 2-butanone 4-phosphate synthase/GTP cyclohydrolase II
MAINPITEIIEDLRQGRMVIVLDDEDRENEGDLLIAAERARPEDINFMARYGRGLICLTLTPARCQQLRLPPMVNDNQGRTGTNFTVSIEAAEGVTTGISAHDRAATIRAAIKKDARPGDIVMPGHVFPLMAQKGGVLARAGHTEAGVDLACLAGFEPASVVCEVMNDDGTMARLPELQTFAAQHGMKVGTIADLIRYRMENEATVQRMRECTVTTEFGDFRVIAYHDTITDKTHLALVKGESPAVAPTLVRVHVQRSLLDLFADTHGPGHWTLQAALQRVASEGAGVVVILNQAESSEDLLKRIELTHKREIALEPPIGRRAREELRTYGLGSQILADLGVTKMRVLGRPMKAPAMSGFGLEIVEYIERERPPRREGGSKTASA